MRFLQTLSTYVQFFFHQGNEFREEGFLNNVNLVVVRLAAVNIVCGDSLPIQQAPLEIEAHAPCSQRRKR
jgi:hypothetical protein